MKRLPISYLFISLLIAGITAISLDYAIYQYLLSQTKEDVQAILLSNRGFHIYIQQDQHPAFYDGVAAGAISKEFYDPRLLSSSYITRVMHGYFNEERKKKGLTEIYYKMAANHPRNLVNMADVAERQLIQKFNADRSLKEYEEVMTVEGKKVFYYAVPFLENGKPCLRCHGKPEDAPPGLRARYPDEGGFNENLGEIRAIESIRIPLAEEGLLAFKISISLATGIFALLGQSFFNTRLRQRVREKTSLLAGEIEARQRVSCELDMAQQQLRAILDSLEALIYVADMETYELLFLNAYGRKIWGEIRGKICWQALQSGQDGPCSFCTNNRLLSEDGKPTGVYVWEFQNTVTGQWFDCRDQAIPWSDGRLVRMEIATDITVRKQAEDEIKRINEGLLAVNRIVMACASTMDAAEILDKVMDEALAITGLEGGTICSISPDETLHIVAHRATSEATIADLTNHNVKIGECLCGQCARDHKPLILRDREAVLHYSTREATRGEDIRFHAAFPLIAANSCLGVLCIFTRTDSKPTEQSLHLLETVSVQIAMAIYNAHLYAESVQLAMTLEAKVQERTADLDKVQVALLNTLEDVNDANAKLKDLDRLKSLFIASMSHELRTPLNSVIGFSKVLANEWVGAVNDEQKKLLLTISRSGKHLLALINDVIDISKIESGKLDTHLEDFDLQEVVNEALEVVKKDLADKQLTLTVAYLSLAMHSDRRRLLQCLLNLLNNAIKFTVAGGVGIEMKMEEGRVLISVTDTGIGIAAEDVPLLFGSFVRLESPLKASVPGTGLGLYLTRKLARETLGGDISVESTEGAGSRFTLAIPVRTNGSSPKLVWGDDGAPVEGK